MPELCRETCSWDFLKYISRRIRQRRAGVVVLQNTRSSKQNSLILKTELYGGWKTAESYFELDGT